MKKRLLSLFLALCMLVALVPTASVTAETADTGTPAAKTSYDDFYVMEGLVGLYPAYASDDGGDASLTIDGGKVTAWVDKISGKTATVFGGFVANRSGKGGFGIAIDVADYANSTLTSGINFSEDYPTLPDYTVETVISYHNLLQNGAAVTTQKYSRTHTAYRVGLYAATWFNGATIDMRAYLSNRAWGQHDGRTTQNVVHTVTGDWCDPSGTIAVSGGAYVGNGYGMTPGKIYTQSFIKITGTATVSLALTLDGSTQRLANTYYGDSASGTQAFTAYTEGSLTLAEYAALWNASSSNQAARFSLLNGVPGDIYAVRIYDRALTAAERAQNHFADLAAYFELDVSGLISSAPLPSSLTDAFAAYTFENGNAATLQALINENRAGTEKSYRDLYVTSGLTALFDAFATDNISLAQSKWYAMVPNAVGALAKKTAIYATMTGGRYSAISNPTGWNNENGLGYSDPQNSTDNALTFQSTLLGTSFEVEAVMKNELRDFPSASQLISSLSVEQLGSETAYTAVGTTSWLVSTTASVTFTNTSDQDIRFLPRFYGLASESSTEPTKEFLVTAVSLAAGETKTIEVGGHMYNRLKVIVPSAVQVTSVHLPLHSNTHEARADSAFVFGNLYAMVWTNLQSSNGYGNGFGTVRWYVANSEWKNHHGGKDSAAFHAQLSDSSAFTQTDGQIYRMSVTRTTASDGVATFSLSHGGNKLSVQSDSAKTLSNAVFTMGNDLPTTFYSVRVYNRELTEAERNRNHVADLFGYTGLDIDFYLAFPAARRAALDEALATVPLSVDKEETTAALQQVILLLLNGNVEGFLSGALSFDKVEPLENTPGYRTLFSVNNATVDVLSENGYTVYYGGLVGVGENAAGLGVKLSGGNLVATGGATLVTVRGGGAATGRFHSVSAEENVYSIAVKYDKKDSYDLETAVRGFIAVVSPKGELRVSYTDSEMPNGRHSMELLADYFVNLFDESALSAASYLQNEALLSVLSARNIPARVEINTDKLQTIHVKPTGNDNALGTLTAPYATLEKAYDRMLELYAAGKTGVIIRLSAGTHRVNNELLLHGDWIGEECELAIVGEGESTVVTSTVPIGAAQNGVITLPEALKGTPFRYLYAVGANGALIHVDNTYTGGPDDFRIFNHAEVKNDTAKTVYVLMDASFFKGNKSYAGTEIHITTEWDFNVIHIDHVDYSTKQPNGSAVPSGYVMVYLNYYEFTNIAIPANHSFKGKEYWLQNSADVFADANHKTDVFYYDRAAGKIHIANYGGDSTVGSTTTFEIPTLERIFTFERAHNVAFLNFTVTGVDNRLMGDDRSYAGGQAGNATIVNKADGATLSSGVHKLAAIYADSITNLFVDGMLITQVAGDGIQLRGAIEDVIIQGSEFSHLGQTSVRIGINATWNRGTHNKRVQILNNYAHHTGELFVQNCGMLITTAMDSRIMGNTITNTTYTGLSVGWRWSEIGWTLEQLGHDNTTHLFRVEIAYNYIADFMTCMRDGGGIYILGGNAENEEHSLFNFMHDNYMVITEATGKHNESQKRWFMGYYHDGASSNWYDSNNVIINATTTGVGNLVPLYVQHISGQLAHNITLEGNYAIGFTGASQVYAGHIIAERYIYANDYLFTGVSAMSAAQKTAAANIFASAGSTLAPTLTDGGLGVNGTASQPSTIYGGTQNELALSSIPGYHPHAFGDWTALDAELHVRTCSCGTARTEAHSYEREITLAPTYVAKGTAIDTCTVCGYAHTVDLPMLTPPEEIFSLKAEKAESTAGATVKVNLLLVYNPGAAHIVFDLAYDASLLTLLRVESVAEGWTLTQNGDRLAFDAATALTTEGVLCTAVFEIAENTPTGDIPVAPLLVSCTDARDNSLTLQTLAASVSVIAVLYGDANGDGLVDGADVIALRSFLLAPTEGNEAGADVNGDGIVDGRDLIVLRKYLVGNGETGPARK